MRENWLVLITNWEENRTKKAINQRIKNISSQKEKEKAPNSSSS
jgi:hypothetical protein